MAKSIFKPGVVLTRLEKKKVQKLLPFPKHGRNRFKWRVENRELTENHGAAIRYLIIYKATSFVEILSEETENEL